MSAEKAETFFNGTIKEVRLNAGGTGLLADKRITMSCVMVFGPIIGMPGWLTDEYSLVAKEGVRRRTSNEAKLEGVEISLFANESQEEPILKVESCSIQGFKFVRGKTKKNGSVGLVSMHFAVSTISFNAKLWNIIPDYSNGTLFMKFAGTQMSMSFGNPVVVPPKEKTEPIDTTDYTDPKYDEDFGAKKADSKTLSPAAQKAADVMAGKSSNKGKHLVH